MLEQFPEVYYYYKGVMKNKRMAIFIALFVSISAWSIVFTLADKYESKAKVHLDTASVIRPLMKGMVIEPDLESIIRIIQQLMFTRPNLEKIVQISQLKDAKDPISNDAIEKLKKEIAIKSAGDKDIFDISYSSNNPDVAKSVVQAVLTVFSEQA